MNRKPDRSGSILQHAKMGNAIVTIAEKLLEDGI